MVPEHKRRLTIGILSLVILAAALALTFLDTGRGDLFRASCWRIGAMLGLLWVAYDDLVRLPKWFLPAIVGSIVIIAVRPKAALVLIPVFLLITLLRPRRK